MSAPERIWVDPDQFTIGYTDNPSEVTPHDAEYIRADAVAEMIRQAVADATGLHLVIAAIREATVGGKPMLSGLPAALLEWRQQAVEQEREACAKVAHDWQNETGTDIAAAARVCPQIAAAIRERGDA